MTRNLTTVALVAFAAAFPSARAITINVQYETPADAFFTPTARATLQKAADDVGNAVTTSLSALNQSTYTGTQGSTDATVEWNFSYTNPNTGVSAPDITTFNFLADEFRVIVGHRDLPGTTLGLGGPGGAGIELSGGGVPAQWDTAVANMETASNANMPRGGPFGGTFDGSFDFAPAPGNYSLRYGFSLGALTFDDMTSWHFDYATLPAFGQNDFYSVAVHELIHSIGFGASDAWDTQVSGTDWFGPAVMNLLGTGTDVLSSGGNHIRSGLEGIPIIDGVYRSDLPLQEAIMDPNLTTGTRKYITDLDLAFLQDMGWDVVAVPEPSTLVLLAFGALIALATATARRRATPLT